MNHLTDIGRLLNVISVISIILLTDNDIAIVYNRVYTKCWRAEEACPVMKF